MGASPQVGDLDRLALREGLSHDSGRQGRCAVASARQSTPDPCRRWHAGEIPVAPRRRHRSRQPRCRKAAPPWRRWWRARSRDRASSSPPATLRRARAAPHRVAKFVGPLAQLRPAAATFSMAMAAWSAKEVASSICFSVNGLTSSRVSTRTPTSLPRATSERRETGTVSRQALRVQKSVLRIVLDVGNVNHFTFEQDPSDNRTAVRFNRKGLGNPRIAGVDSSPPR